MPKKKTPEVKSPVTKPPVTKQVVEVTPVVLLKPHTHRGTLYKIGTNIDDIKGLTGANVAYMKSQNVIS